MRYLAFALALFVAPTSVARADDETVARLIADTGTSYSYAEYTPPGYDTEGDDVFHPVVIFLHGQGELSPAASGAEVVIEETGANGPLRLIRTGDERFAEAGVIVLAPLGQTEDGWWNDGKLRSFLAYAMARYRVDWRRVYVTGISMGGGGTFMVGNVHGARAAAYVPICPAGEANGTSYVDVPVWGFHSVDDGRVGIASTWTSFDRIADARAGRDVAGPSASYPRDGADHTAIFDVAAGTFGWVDGRDGTGGSPLRATIYPDDSHDSWSRSYADGAVWDWVFAQRRPIPDGLPEETLFVDALHPGVTLSGSWARADDRAGYFFWDLATATAGEGTEAVFPLRVSEDGMHEIYLRHVAVPGATMASIVIAHAEGEETVVVDLAADGGAFASLAEVPLRADGSATLTLRGADGATGTLVADAVAIVRRGPLSPEDAGVIAPDGGSMPGTDGGVAADAGVRLDASVDAGSSGSLTGSCGCRAASRGGSMPLAALAGWVALVLSRRRATR
jgi:dienelactone hydrolase